MLRNGYWYNLETQEWEVKMFPPNNLYVQEIDSLYYFRGKPTIFGSPVCEGDGTCSYVEVDQYDPDTDTWNKLGNLIESRGFQAVIEVPQSLCDQLPDMTTITTESTVQPTTEPVTDPTEEPPDQTTAALIIGGSWSDADILKSMASVEIFGCPGYEDRSFPLPDYPFGGVMLTGATYFPNSQEVGKLIACGGFLCQNPVIDEAFCKLGDECYEWTVENEWQAAPPLTQRKWSHLMALVKNLDDTSPITSEERVPLVIGQNHQTQIYNVTTREWTVYKELPGTEDMKDWIVANCLIQIDDFIYHIGLQFYELDTLSWNFTRNHSIPEFLQNPGTCSPLRHRGVQGRSTIRVPHCKKQRISQKKILWHKLNFSQLCTI